MADPVASSTEEPAVETAQPDATASGGTSNPFDTALDAATTDLGGQLQQFSTMVDATRTPLQKMYAAGGAAGLGAMKGIVNTANMVGDMLGLPKGHGVMQSPVLDQIYGASAELDRENPINGFADQAGQFAVGLLGVGKVFEGLGIAKALSTAPGIAKFGGEVVKGAAAAYAALDPHMARLSDLVQSVPQLRNPINAFLASSPDDSDSMGRLKNAIEGAGVDVAVGSVLTAAVKTLKIAGEVMQGVKPKAALDASVDELTTATQQAGKLGDQWVIPGENHIDPATGEATIVVHGGAPVTKQPIKAAADFAGDVDGTGGAAGLAATNERVGSNELASKGPIDSNAVSEVASKLEAHGDIQKMTAPELRSVAHQAEAAGDGQMAAELHRYADAVDELDSTRTLASDEGLRGPAESVSEEANPQTGAGAGTADPKKFTLSNVAEKQDVETVIHSYEQSQAILNKYGTRANALDEGVMLPDGNLPWQKLNGSEGYRAFHDQVASEFRSALDDMKGGPVLRDSMVNDLVEQRVKLFNEDPSEVLGELHAAGNAANRMVADMEASFAIANKAGDDLYQLVRQVKVGNYSRFGGDEIAAKAAIGQRLSLYIEAIGHAQSMRAAMGRGMRRLRSEFKITPETIERINSMTPDQLADIVDMSDGDPRMLVQMATRGFWDRVTNAIGTMFANNLLWLWPTHLRNMAGNTFMLAATPAMRAVGSFALGSAGNDVRTIALREYRYMLSSLGDAMEFAGKAYLKGDSVLNPHSNEFFRAAGSDMPTNAAGEIAASLDMRPMNTVGDVLHNGLRGLGFILNQPTRALGMADEFIKQTSYRASVLSKASLDADKLGLAGSEYQDYLQHALNAAFDEKGHATDPEALYDAQVRTFQQPLLPGTFGKEVVQATTNKFPITRLVLPFVRTPINLVRYAWKMTPGLNVLSAEYRQMLTGQLGKNRMADAYGQMLMGITAGSTILGMANAGMITGGAPADAAQAKALADTGWKPYSFVHTNADGSHTYLPFNQIDPIGMLFGIVADIHQIATQGNVSDQSLDKLVLPVVIATAKNITDRTYLQSLTQTLQALSDPERSAGKMLGNVAANLLPASSLLREVNPDPYMRDARGIVDSVMANLPGFSNKLPPRRDPFGDPVNRAINVVFADKPNDIVDAEQQRTLTNFGIGVTSPSPRVAGGVDLRTITLPSGQTAFDRYQELASKPTGADVPLKQKLAKLIQSDDYRKLVDGDGAVKGTKLYALNAVVRKYREAALKQLQQENPEVARQMGARQQAVREAVRNSDQAGDQANNKVNGFVSKSINAVNKAFGIQP